MKHYYSQKLSNTRKPFFKIVKGFIFFLCIAFSVKLGIASEGYINKNNSSAPIASIIVTNFADAGPGSLRQAILDANATPGVPDIITFSTGPGTISIGSTLPSISDEVFIDGAGEITIDAGGANNPLDHFNIVAGADNTTIKGLTLIRTGSDIIEIMGAVSGITIEDIVIGADNHWINYGILVSGPAIDLTIKNVTMTEGERNFVGILFTDTASNVLIDNFNYSDGDGELARGIQFQGVATDITITNCILDMDDFSDPLVNGDDGNYGITFDSNATNVLIEGNTINSADVTSIGFYGTANNITIQNNNIDSTQGSGISEGIRFNSTTDTVLIDNNIINLNIGDYGIVLLGANSDVTVTNNTIDSADLDGIYIGAASTNLLIDGNTIINSDTDAIEFYNNVPNTNVVISNNTIDNAGLGRAGIVFSTLNPISEFTIDGNTISNTSQYGIYNWVGADGLVGDTVDIINNILFGNTSAGIYLGNGSDSQLISQNSIYNNGVGIDIINSANCNYQQNLGFVPDLENSFKIAPNTYEVTFTLPAICASGDCDVEFYANNPGDTPNNGRTLVQTFTGLSSGNQIVTITCTDAACNVIPAGFWTATLTREGTCGTSEFSRSLLIDPKGPACVDSGIAMWLRGDYAGRQPGTLVVGSGWDDFSGNTNNLGENNVVGAPVLTDNVMNFNPAVIFDGNSWTYDLNSSINNFPTGNDDRTVFVVSKVNVTSFRSPFSFGNFAANENHSWRYENGVIRYIGYFNDFASPAGAYITNEPFIGMFDHDGALASINTNGNQVATAATTYATNMGAGVFHLGVRTGAAAEGFIGDISEVIVYNRKISPAEQNLVHSYLGIKYGITLDQTTPTSYIASDGSTIMWDSSAPDATIYNNAIFGVGRDDCTFLGQIKSKSVNTEAIITLVVEGESLDDSNLLDNYNFTDLDNNEFLTIGNDNGSDTWNTDIVDNDFRLLNRNWSVQETGDIGTVKLDFDMGDADFDVPNQLIAGTLYYFVFDSNNDGSLLDEVQGVGILPMTYQGFGDVWQISGFDFVDGMEFTIGTLASEDFGDAPDTYSTDLIAGNSGSDLVGPSHFIDAVTYMGGVPDYESDGQPDPTATGDGADEDGVVLPFFVQGIASNITVTTTEVVPGTAYLTGWIDWNADGDFADVDEQIIIDLQDGAPDDIDATANGTIVVSITPPCDAVVGVTFARFRFSDTPNLSYSGAANNGEVEDYQVTIISGAPILTPNLDVDVCSDEPSGIILSDVAGIAATYNITNINTNGLTASAGIPTVINGVLDTEIADDAYTNVTNLPIVVTYTIVPITANGCDGEPVDVMVRVNPEPILEADISAVVCSDIPTGLILSDVEGIAESYNISAINFNGLTPSAGIPTIGTGFSENEIADDAYVNNSTDAIDVIYTVVPVCALGCIGDPEDVIITVDPGVKSTNFVIPLIVSEYCADTDPYATATIENSSLLDGNYIVTYNLGGANIGQNLTAPLTVFSGNGSFTIGSENLPNLGDTNIWISDIDSTTSICDSANNLILKEVIYGVCQPETLVSVSQGVSPNGDGKNDFLNIEFIDRYPNNEVKIFNRWGVLVYDVEGYNNDDKSFNGTSNGRLVINKNNEKLPTGTYYYAVTIRNEEGQNISELAGYLYLNRE